MKKIIFTKIHKDAKIPSFATSGSAGMDVSSAKDMTLEAGKFALVPTGLKVAMPNNLEIQIRPRSGNAFRHGISCVNSPGTIDSDYRGELGVLLINHGGKPFEIKVGDRIAQLIVNEVHTTYNKLIEISEIENSDFEELDTSRGDGGFGSTGK